MKLINYLKFLFFKLNRKCNYLFYKKGIIEFILLHQIKGYKTNYYEYQWKQHNLTKETYLLSINSLLGSFYSTLLGKNDYFILLNRESFVTGIVNVTIFNKYRVIEDIEVHYYAFKHFLLSCNDVKGLDLSDLKYLLKEASKVAKNERDKNENISR